MLLWTVHSLLFVAQQNFVENTRIWFGISWPKKSITYQKVQFKLFLHLNGFKNLSIAGCSLLSEVPELLVPGAELRRPVCPPRGSGCSLCQRSACLMVVKIFWCAVPWEISCRGAGSCIINASALILGLPFFFFFYDHLHIPVVHRDPGIHKWWVKKRAFQFSKGF